VSSKKTREELDAAEANSELSLYSTHTNNLFAVRTAIVDKILQGLQDRADEAGAQLRLTGSAFGGHGAGGGVMGV
jgi:hypothetical protein